MQQPSWISTCGRELISLPVREQQFFTFTWNQLIHKDDIRWPCNRSSPINSTHLNKPARE
uniref:Uncharacterized protein n=1 Tax=Rhizophora mucronata TaxID=61149 RepID=A0A2P2NHP8_RHIMU